MLGIEQMLDLRNTTLPGRPLEFGAAAIDPVQAPLSVHHTRGDFALHSESFSLITDDQTPAFHDLTDLARAVVARSGVDAGTLTVSTRHTTCAVVVQENEPLLLRDMADRLNRYASADEEYRHNDFTVRTINMCEGECANGHAHCQHLLLGAAVTLPLLMGELVLGVWQRIFLVELDRARLRHFSIQALGVCTTSGQDTQRDEG